MRVAIISESPADEAAIRVLVQAVLGESIEQVSCPSQRSGGFAEALRVVESTLKWACYKRQAEAVVVVVDSNSSPVHEGPADQPCGHPAKCRLCVARSHLAAARRALGREFRTPAIPTAVGLTVPAIEAWYLCGKERNVSEMAWVQGLKEGRWPYTRARLKELVYGIDRPTRALETARAVEEMQRVAQDIELFHRKFPVGFGSLLADLRAWGRR